MLTMPLTAVLTLLLLSSCLNCSEARHFPKGWKRDPTRLDRMPLSFGKRSVHHDTLTDRLSDTLKDTLTDTFSVTRKRLHSSDRLRLDSGYGPDSGESLDNRNLVDSGEHLDSRDSLDSDRLDNEHHLGNEVPLDNGDVFESRDLQSSEDSRDRGDYRLDNRNHQDSMNHPDSTDLFDNGDSEDIRDLLYSRNHHLSSVHKVLLSMNKRGKGGWKNRNSRAKSVAEWAMGDKRLARLDRMPLSYGKRQKLSHLSEELDMKDERTEQLDLSSRMLYDQSTPEARFSEQPDINQDMGEGLVMYTSHIPYGRSNLNDRTFKQKLAQSRGIPYVQRTLSARPFDARESDVLEDILLPRSLLSNGQSLVIPIPPDFTVGHGDKRAVFDGIPVNFGQQLNSEPGRAADKKVTFTDKHSSVNQISLKYDKGPDGMEHDDSTVDTNKRTMFNRISQRLGKLLPNPIHLQYKNTDSGHRNKRTFLSRMPLNIGKEDWDRKLQPEAKTLDVRFLLDGSPFQFGRWSMLGWNPVQRSRHWGWQKGIPWNRILNILGKKRNEDRFRHL